MLRVGYWGWFNLDWILSGRFRRLEESDALPLTSARNLLVWALKYRFLQVALSLSMNGIRLSFSKGRPHAVKFPTATT